MECTRCLGSRYTTITTTTIMYVVLHYNEFFKVKNLKHIKI